MANYQTTIGKSIEYESVKERIERLNSVATQCIEALDPILEGLNARDVEAVLTRIKTHCDLSLMFSSVGASQAPT